VNDKGIWELAAAWQRLRGDFPALHLLLCGDFEVEDPVPGEIRDGLLADARVHFTHGFVRDLAPVYAAIDVCVLPSFREGLPTVALECGAMEVPIVATRIPGCVDAVADGITGLLVEARDAGALAGAAARLLGSRELRRRMGKAARAFVAARFSERRVFELLVREYRACGCAGNGR
jgi:glycosyltransferase involved in cell wall biosynthesis